VICGVGGWGGTDAEEWEIRVRAAGSGTIGGWLRGEETGMWGMYSVSRVLLDRS
jgi:hypothetical protein